MDEWVDILIDRLVESKQENHSRSIRPNNVETLGNMIRKKPKEGNKTKKRKRKMMDGKETKYRLLIG